MTEALKCRDTVAFLQELDYVELRLRSGQRFAADPVADGTTTGIPDRCSSKMRVGVLLAIGAVILLSLDGR